MHLRFLLLVQGMVIGESAGIVLIVMRFWVYTICQERKYGLKHEISLKFEPCALMSSNLEWRGISDWRYITCYNIEWYFSTAQTWSKLIWRVVRARQQSECVRCVTDFQTAIQNGGCFKMVGVYTESKKLDGKWRHSSRSDVTSEPDIEPALELV